MENIYINIPAPFLSTCIFEVHDINKKLNSFLYKINKKIIYMFVPINIRILIKTSILKYYCLMQLMNCLAMLRFQIFLRLFLSKMEKINFSLSTTRSHVRGDRGIAPPFLNPGTRYKWVFSFTAHWIEAGWAPDPVWMFCRREIVLPQPAIESQTVQTIT
jgi:hypothetical protein